MATTSRSKRPTGLKRKRYSAVLTDSIPVSASPLHKSKDLYPELSRLLGELKGGDVADDVAEASAKFATSWRKFGRGYIGRKLEHKRNQLLKEKQPKAMYQYQLVRQEDGLLKVISLSQKTPKSVESSASGLDKVVVKDIGTSTDAGPTGIRETSVNSQGHLTPLQIIGCKNAETAASTTQISSANPRTGKPSKSKRGPRHGKNTPNPEGLRSVVPGSRRYSLLKELISNHLLMMNALSSYTRLRARIPRELRELGRNGRSKAADRQLILDYQEQMNILLKSEYCTLLSIHHKINSGGMSMDNYLHCCGPNLNRLVTLDPSAAATCGTGYVVPVAPTGPTDSEWIITNSLDLCSASSSKLPRISETPADFLQRIIASTLGDVGSVEIDNSDQKDDSSTPLQETTGGDTWNKLDSRCISTTDGNVWYSAPVSLSGSQMQPETAVGTCDLWQTNPVNKDSMWTDFSDLENLLQADCFDF